MSIESSEARSLVDENSNTPDYNAVFGEGEKKVRFAQQTVLGEVRNVRRFGWLEWAFLVVASLSMLAALGVTIGQLVTFEKNFINISAPSGSNSDEYILANCNKWICMADFTFAIVLLINLGFTAFYCYDGLLRERPFEIIGFVVAVIVIILYIIINYAVNGKEDQVVRLARLVVVVVIGPVNIVLALIIWWKMGYLVFTTIGSNTRLVWAYKFRSFFLTLQLFNLEAMASLFALAWAQDGLFLVKAEKIVLPIVLVLVTVSMLIGWAAVLYEVHFVAGCWYPFVGVAFAYYLYKVVNVSHHFPDYTKDYYEFDHLLGKTSVGYRYVGHSLLVAACLGMIVCVLMVIVMVIAQINFGKGLKDKIKPPFMGPYPCSGPVHRLAVWYAERKARSALLS